LIFGGSKKFAPPLLEESEIPGLVHFLNRLEPQNSLS
jgi:hypothetical protein